MGTVYTLENTSAELEQGRPELAILPLAQHEPHGPHLPVGTDGIIVGALASRIAGRLEEPVFLLPVWPVGTSGPHRGQPGTVSLEPETLWAVVADIAASLEAHGIRKLVVINGHGLPTMFGARPWGSPVVKTAVRQLNYEHPSLTAVWFQPFALAGPVLRGVFPTGDIHAGDLETSVLLYLAPELVRGSAPDFLPDQPPSYLEFAPFASLSPTGVWGRPSQASAEKGRLAVEAAVRASVEYINWTLGFLGQVRPAERREQHVDPA
jgi:creatinine amidohydrolase